MKKKRFSVEQIVGVLKQAEVGVTDRGAGAAGGDFRADLLPLEEAVREAGGGPAAATEAVAENQRLKRLVADLTLDKTMLQDVLAKKF